MEGEHRLRGCPGAAVLVELMGKGRLHHLRKEINFFLKKTRTNLRHKEPFARLVHLQTGTEITISRNNSYS